MSENQDKPTEIDLTSADAPAPSAASGQTASSNEPTPAPTAEERIALLETEKSEIKDRMLRIAADFDNYKKRARKDQLDGEARAKETVLRDFLEVTDNLERATASWGEGKETDAKAIRDGVELVLRQFRSKLERYQVRAVEAVGQAFDPRFHEAISQMPSPDAKPGSVVHELQKGYMIGERLLRPAMVVVAVAPPAPAATPAPEASTEASKGNEPASRTSETSGTSGTSGTSEGED
jgi:molecular chaperone GrpE